MFWACSSAAISSFYRWCKTCLLPLRSFPCFGQLGPVQGRPLGDEAQRARGETALQDGQAANVDDRALLTVANVKVRRWMVAVIHQDHKPEEAAELGHAASPSPSRWPSIDRREARMDRSAFARRLRGCHRSSLFCPVRNCLDKQVE